MKFSTGSIALLGIIISFAARPACAGSGERSPALLAPGSIQKSGTNLSFKAVLAEAGLEYGGARPFIISKNYRRGDWKGARPAFWTLASSAGPVRLRLEMTKNISRAQAEKTMAGRFLRIDALYSGGAAYPGMVTTEFEVPPQLRPKDIRTGSGEQKVKVLAATPSMAYGAGSEDLVSHRGLLGYVYCEKIPLLAQIELFFPKEKFGLEEALREFDTISCSASVSGSVDDNQAVKKGK